MKVSATRLRALFVAMGRKTAGKWSDEVLAAKLPKIESLAEEDGEIEDKGLAKLFKQIVRALKIGDTIEIESDDDREKPEPPELTAAREGKTAKPKKSAKDDDDPDEDDEDEDDGEEKKRKPKKPTKDRKKKGVGIVATIVACLRKATAKKPITRAQIHAKLVETFPDRDPSSMLSTVNTQVPNYLRRVKGLNVQKSDKGFYLEDDA